MSEREPTIEDVKKGLAKPQHRLEGGPWVDGYPSRAGKHGVNVRLRYVWLDVPVPNASLEGK